MELGNQRDRLQVGLLLLSGLLVFALFTIYPIVKLRTWLSTGRDLGWSLHQKFIGLQNYIDVLSDDVPDCICKYAALHACDCAGQRILGLGRGVNGYPALPRHVPRDLLHPGH